MKLKTIAQGSFFLSLCCIAIIYLWQSNQGLHSYLKLKKEFQDEVSNVQELEHNINDIKQKIEQWHTDSFEQEKIARQDLGMSFTNELVYVTP